MSTAKSISFIVSWICAQMLKTITVNSWNIIGFILSLRVCVWPFFRIVLSFPVFLYIYFFLSVPFYDFRGDKDSSTPHNNNTRTSSVAIRRTIQFKVAYARAKILFDMCAIATIAAAAAKLIRLHRQNSTESSKITGRKTFWFHCIFSYAISSNTFWFLRRVQCMR